MPSQYTDQLPLTRCTPEMRRALDLIAETSITPSIGAHIRAALQHYIDNHLPAAGQDQAASSFADSARVQHQQKPT